MAEMPLTGYAAKADNPLFRRFWGIVPIERASALIYYVKGSGWQRAVHDFKYRSAWRIAKDCGCKFYFGLESMEDQRATLGRKNRSCDP